MFNPHPRKFDWQAAKQNVQKLMTCNLKPSPEHTCSPPYIITDQEVLLKQKSQGSFHFRRQKCINSPLNVNEKMPETYKLLASWLGTAKYDQILARYFYSFFQTLNPEFPGLLNSFFPQWIVIFSASLLKIQSFRCTDKCKHRHRTWSLSLPLFSPWHCSPVVL